MAKHKESTEELIRKEILAWAEEDKQWLPNINGGMMFKGKYYTEESAELKRAERSMALVRRVMMQTLEVACK